MLSARAVSSLLLAYAGFVVYGSLVPLDFHPMPLPEAWRRFQAIPFLQLGVGSRADWIANGVLYAPLGFLTAWRLLRGGCWPAVAAFVAVALGVGLALGVEFAQVFFPPRTVSLNDLMAECIGTVLGALVALAYQRRGSTRIAAQLLAGPWLRTHGLQLYVAAYLAFCLFPYDVLISRAELDQKLASDLMGWWIAGQGRLLIVALRLIIEVALMAPLGLLLGRRAGARSAPTYGWAALVGLAFGFGVEGAQLLIASGVTQGASVLTRMLGVMAGLALWRRRERWSVEGVRAGLARWARAWVPAYLLLLVAVNGWFAFDWQGQSAASAQWRELRFLPFHYHYYTTEAQALFSLVNVMMAYMPVGVLAWAWRRSAGAAALWGAALCALIEASKLWLAGLHPDPTNLWIAAAACWAFVKGADGWSLRAAVPGNASAVDAPPVDGGARSTGTGPRYRGSARGAILLGIALLLVVLHLLSAPAFATASAVLLAACAAAVWLNPLAAMLIVPALLPAFDLAPWTGRFFWDEFDLLLAVCLAVGYLRSSATRKGRADGPWRLAFALLATSFAASAVVGAMPWPWPDANSFVSYYSPYNALRIAKGVLWAWLFVGLMLRLDRNGHDTRRALASGMTLGLTYVVAFVVWERVAFIGLFDFADEYRVTGPFSAMHRGGAFIECFIAIALPFVALRVLEARQWVAGAAGAALLVGASYAMMVTFSRNGYAAFVVALLFVVALTRGASSWRRACFGGLLAAVMLGVALPVLLGPFAQGRLANWGHDLAVRKAHWNDALEMRDNTPLTTAFGMGLGRFPATHFWRSREPVRAGSFRLEADGETRYLRLAGGGGPLYLDQIVTVAPMSTYALKLRLRANKPAAQFDLSLCEKWMLTSRTCVAASARAGATAGAWTTIETMLDVARLTESRGAWPRPLKLSLHTPAGGTLVDVTDITLRTSDGQDLLSNGDFRSGLDRWFFSTDVDPPWHIHSLPVAVLFDQGWFGVAAWTLLLVTALYHGARQAWHGDRNVAAALAALVAFLVSGSLNTLIDDPRFLFLLLVITALSCATRRLQARGSYPPRNDRFTAAPAPSATCRPPP